MEQRLDIQAIIDQQQMRPQQCVLVAVCFLVLAVDSFDAYSIAFAAPSLIAQWQIDKVALTPVFTANVIGLALGALLFGPLADRVGRRQTLCAILLLCGALTLAKALSSTILSLTIFQFLGSLPVGGAYPVVLSIVAENVGRRWRPAYLTGTGLGFNLGATTVGVIAVPLIAYGGWQCLFLTGGSLALLLGVLVWMIVPDSVHQLSQRSESAERLLRAVQRLAPTEVPDALPVLRDGEETHQQGQIADLFAPGRRALTLLLWIAFTSSCTVYYFLFSWLPVLLGGTGFTLNQALLTSAVYPAGGFVGAAIFIVLSRWVEPALITIGLSALSACSIILLGIAPGSLLVEILFVTGVGSVGVLLAGNTLASLLYPSQIRSTGVGWAFGVGRFGSMMGPLVGGLMVSLSLSFSAMCIVIAAPAAIGLLAYGCLAPLSRRQ